jgi:glycosyltransferase involved in cell wall biosynthesis
MKICQVHPGCGIEVPPKSWGAIEKIVWEYKINLEKLGHTVDVKYVNDINPKDYDIIHCHVTNLANLLYEKGIEYVYQMHDHHSYHYGKDSYLYKETIKAISNSKIALMPAKYLNNYFESDKCIYFSHGVNTDFYTPDFTIDKEDKKCFLMLANNGLAGDKSYDRKGFEFGIALANMTGEKITVAGPDNNQWFFNSNLHTLSYPKLTISFNPTQEEALKLFQTHKIFLNPTMLEAGHPNLTMLEAAACGMPIIADWEMETDFHGAWRAPRNVFEMYRGYKDIMNNYNEYSKKSLTTAHELSWYNRSIALAKLYKELI